LSPVLRSGVLAIPPCIWNPAYIQGLACNQNAATISTSYLDLQAVSGSWYLFRKQVLFEVLWSI